MEGDGVEDANLCASSFITEQIFGCEFINRGVRRSLIRKVGLVALVPKPD